MLHKFKLVALLALLIGWSIGIQAAQQKALSKHDLFQLLAGGVYNARIAQLVRERGITFVPNSRDLSSLRQAGADLALLNAVESARHITAQISEPSKFQPKRQVTLPAVTHPVKSIPHNTLNVLPIHSVVPRTVPPTPPKLPTHVPAP